MRGTEQSVTCEALSRRTEADRLVQDRVSHLPLNAFANQRTGELAAGYAILMLRNCLFCCVFLNNLFFSSSLGDINRQESGQCTSLRRTFCIAPLRVSRCLRRVEANKWRQWIGAASHNPSLITPTSQLSASTAPSTRYRKGRLPRGKVWCDVVSRRTMDVSTSNRPVCAWSSPTMHLPR